MLAGDGFRYNTRQLNSPRLVSLHPSSLAEYPHGMDVLKRAMGNNKRNLLLAVALLVSTLYVWQTASAWQDAHDQYEVQRGAVAYYGEGGVLLDTLKGAGGATAILRVYGRADVGQLLVQDLPILLPSQTYRLWCIDGSGTVDAAGDFSVPADGSGVLVVDVVAPQLLTSYTRFLVTVESVGSSSSTPSGRVVMSNR
jgi:Anti-sigma-K factor rskA